MKGSGVVSISVAEKVGRPWWLWLHVLSLDAVLVGLVGLEAFAQVAGVVLGGLGSLVVWALCVAGLLWGSAAGWPATQGESRDGATPICSTPF